ncbi:MAG: hypothetical protein PHX78_04590 [bacterium]|nr:hypothetical protein [bacterium]
MSTGIEKISLVALTGIFIAVVSLFLGHTYESNDLRVDKVVVVSSPLQSNIDSARSYFNQNDYIPAISEYRKAIEAEPNYLDEKSELFLGDEIKNVIKKTIYELTEKLKKDPGDKNTKQGLKDAYYMRRRFGRGCE